MLGKEWFKPEMPVKEFLLGVYEWISDTDSAKVAGGRLLLLQDYTDTKGADPELTGAMVYALVKHNNCCLVRVMHRSEADRKKYPHGDDPALEEMRAYGKEMTEDYFVWIADPKQVEKDLAQIEKEDTECAAEHPERQQETPND